MRCAEGVLRKAVIRCAPGFSVGWPWVLGLLARVVWLTQSGPRTGPHFPPITAPCGCMALKCTLKDVAPGPSRTGTFCSACFLRLRLAFYIAHASIQTSRSIYTRSMSQARPSAYLLAALYDPPHLQSCQPAKQGHGSLALSFVWG